MYDPNIWHNDTTPSIDEDNLNHMEQGIAAQDKITDKVNIEVNNVYNNVLTKKTLDVTVYVGGIQGDVGDIINFTTSTSYRRYMLNVNADEVYSIEDISLSTSSNYPYYIMTTDNNGVIIDQFAPRPTDSALRGTYVVPISANAKRLYVMSRREQEDFNQTAKQFIFNVYNEIDDIHDKMGEVVNKLTPISIQSVDVHGVSGNVGSAIQFGETTSYGHNVFLVNVGEKYDISCAATASATYPYYVYCTDGNDIIISRHLPAPEVSGKTSGLVTIPDGATKMYVMCRGTSSTNMKVSYAELYPLQNQILDIGGESEGDVTLANLAREGLWKSSILNHDRNGISFVFITDTHSNGEFLNAARTELITGLTSKVSVEVYKNVAKSGMVDFGVHCGDIISSYDITKEEYVETLAKYISDYDGFRMPVFFVKGNHECNHEDGWYQAADVISKQEYYANVQRRDSEWKVTNPDDKFGGYYYHDFEQYKIRAIFLNAYMDPDEYGISTNFGTVQKDWFQYVALNLSDKEDASDWGIVVFSHPSASTSQTIKLLRSFSGPGTLIGLIHGHTHQDQYTNEDNYNNIGVNKAFATAGQTGANGCCVDIFTLIPTVAGTNANGVIYETRIGVGNSRSFSWGENIGQLS